METSTVRNRLNLIIDAAKRSSAERRTRNDEAARAYERFRAYGPDGDLVGVLARIDDVLVPDRLVRHAS